MKKPAGFIVLPLVCILLVIMMSCLVILHRNAVIAYSIAVDCVWYTQQYYHTETALRAGLRYAQQNFVTLVNNKSSHTLSLAIDSTKAIVTITVINDTTLGILAQLYDNGHSVYSLSTSLIRKEYDNELPLFTIHGWQHTNKFVI